MVHVAANDERDRDADRSTFPEHVQVGQILRIEAELDAPADQRRVDRIAIAGERHGCCGRHPPQY
jgi:hypothetical protein